MSDSFQKDKSSMQEEAKLHGKARKAKTHQLLEMGYARFCKMHVFTAPRPNKNRGLAEKFYYVFNFADYMNSEADRLRAELLESMKDNEEVVIPELNLVVRKECGEVVFDEIKTDVQWKVAIEEWKKENK